MPALLVGREGSKPLWTAPDPFPGTKIILSLQLPLQLFTEKHKSPPQYKPVPRHSHSLIAWAKNVGRKPTVGKDLYCQGKLSLNKWDRTEQVCKAHFTWTTWHKKHIKTGKKNTLFIFLAVKPRLASNLKCAPSASPVLGPQVPVTMPRVQRLSVIPGGKSCEWHGAPLRCAWCSLHKHSFTGNVILSWCFR